MPSACLCVLERHEAQVLPPTRSNQGYRESIPADQGLPGGTIHMCAHVHTAHYARNLRSAPPAPCFAIARDRAIYCVQGSDASCGVCMLESVFALPEHLGREIPDAGWCHLLALYSLSVVLAV